MGKERIMTGNHTTSALRAIIVAIAIATPAAATAQPAPEDLATALNLELPAWWQVANVDIRASVNDGDEITPRYRQRIVVDLAPTENLYLHVEEVHPFTVVAPVADSVYRLYGVAFAALEREEWKTRFDFENPENLGKAMPKGMFSQPVLISGTDAAQEALDSFMDAREIAAALAERTAANAASAGIIAELDAQAAGRLDAMKGRMEVALAEIDSGMDRIVAAANAASAGIIAELDAQAAGRLDAMKGRMEVALAEIDSGIERMTASNQATLDRLATLGEQRVAAAAARADTLAAIAEGKAEIEAQEELEAVLEELAAKIRRNAELEAASVTADLEADKKLQDDLRARLVSEDLSERMAAFRHAMAQEDGHLRRIALDSAFSSGLDEMQGAALAEVIADLPQLTIIVSGGDWTYYQTLKIAETDGSAFLGEMTTDGSKRVLTMTGSIQGDTLSVHADSNDGLVCMWQAGVDEKGILSGKSQCRWHGSPNSGFPDGAGAVLF